MDFAEHDTCDAGVRGTPGRNRICMEVTMSKKFLYLFKEGHDAFGGDQTSMKNILGGKGAGLAEMTPGLHHHHRSLHPVLR